MERDGAVNIWMPLAASTAAIAILSTTPLSLLLLLPVIGLMIFVIQVQLYHERELAKSFWLTTYLRQDSPIRHMLRGSTLLRWLATCAAIPLAIVTYIAVFSYDFWDCLAVAIGICAAKRLHHEISEPIDSNLAEHLTELTHLRVYYWLAIVSVLVALALSSVAKGVFTDYSQTTSDQLASQTIEAVKHPVRFVQHCVRTLRYSELQLLRIRDINGWPYGWLIYFFFLVPNALPAFGLVTLYAGGERLLAQRMNNA